MTRVLLVEDDLWLAELLVAELTTADMMVTHSPHGDAAIDAIDQELPEVIVSDLLLTGGTALALLHELQSYADTKQIPVIVCSNVVDSVTADMLASYGVKRVLDKATMHPSDVVTAVRAVTS